MKRILFISFMAILGGAWALVFFWALGVNFNESARGEALADTLLFTTLAMVVTGYWAFWITEKADRDSLNSGGSRNSTGGEMR